MKAGTCLPMYVILLLTPVAALHAQAIRSPWDGHPVAATDAAESCPRLPPVPADLTTDGFYKLGDATHSIIDPKRMEAYTQSSGPPKAAATAIVHEADRYRTTGSRAAALCTISLLEQMAQANAMGGHMSSGQAYYVQGWLAGAMAIAYLKVRDSGVAKPEQTKAIAAWLGHLGASTRDWYDAALAKKPEANNHLYWAGLQLCAISSVTGNRKDFDWCVAAYRNGVRQIAADGTLPLEMSRGARALHYHLYALAPLVLIAEFGEDNGVPLYAENHHALERLVRASVAGLDDPAPFAKRAGVAQERDSHPGGDAMAWAPPYLARFPDEALQRYVSQAPNLFSLYMGGLPAPGTSTPKP
jgi:poly(beta-D-mannuronate) lyase